MSSESALGDGWRRRYSSLPRGRVEAVTSMPDGGFAFAASGDPNAAATIDFEGNVRKSVGLLARPGAIAGGQRGGVFVTVASTSENRFDTIIKFDADLAAAWSKQLIQNGKAQDVISIEGTRDGGVVAMTSRSLVKLNAGGNPQWAFAIKGATISIQDVEQLDDETYVCAGSSDGKPWLAGVSARGELRWQLIYGGTEGVFRAVDQLQTGDLVAVGSSLHQGLIVRAREDGAVVTALMTTLNIPGWSVAVTREGFVAGLFDAGYANLIAFRTDGTQRWQRLVTPRRGDLNTFSPLTHGMSGGKDGVLLGFPVAAPQNKDGVVQLAKVADINETECNLEEGNTILVAVPLAATPARGLAESVSVRSRPTPVNLAPIALAGSIDACPLEPRPAKPSTFSTRSPERLKTEGDRYRGLLKRRDYDTLEKLVRELRSHPVEDPIRPQDDLYRFYRAFVPIDSTEEEIWDLLEGWLAAQPQSAPARIALAEAYYSAAWRRRGGGGAAGVTDLGWREYDRLLAKAETVLDQSNTEAQGDPYYWHLLISVKHERGQSDTRTIAHKALALHPSTALARQAAFYLTSKWGGSPEEVESFASEAAEWTRPVLGDGAYMAIADQAANEALNGSLGDDARAELKAYSFDWERVHRGGVELIARAPDWIPTHHRLALLAFLFGDRATARELFSQKALDWHPDVLWIWMSDSRYDEAKRWALASEQSQPQPAAQRRVIVEASPPAQSHRAETFVTQATSRWPRLVLQSSLQAETETFNLAAFLVETLDGVVAISAVPRASNQLDVKGVTDAARSGHLHWFFSVPSKQRLYDARSIVTRDASTNQRGVAVDLGISRKRSPLQPLRVRRFRSLSEFQDRVVFIVACKWLGERCEQTTLQGQLFSLQTGTGSSLRTIQIGFKEAFDANALAGGAVLDANGQVLAVVSGAALMGSADYETIVDADVLDSVLP